MKHRVIFLAALLALAGCQSVEQMKARVGLAAPAPQPAASVPAVPSAPAPQPVSAGPDLPLDEPESGPLRDRLVWAMERTGWVQAKAARLLGMTTRQVSYALRKYNIEIKRF